jgi:hypothetical protein
VARHLRELAAEPDPFVLLLENDRGLSGDLYELRIPDQAGQRVTTRDLPAGKAYALRPAFRELGPVAALVYETLESARKPASRFEVADVACLSPAAAAEALRVLAEFGLADRTPAGWRLGVASVSAVAEQLGVDEQLAVIRARYAVERAAWRALLGAVRLTVADIIRPNNIADLATGPPPGAESPVEVLERILGAYVVETASWS